MEGDLESSFTRPGILGSYQHLFNHYSGKHLRFDVTGGITLASFNVVSMSMRKAPYKELRMKHLFSTGAILALLACSTLQASPFLDFNIDGVQNATTSISYAGGVAPLVGTDIQVDDVLGMNTPLNNGVVRTILNGELDFTTGNHLGTVVVMGTTISSFGGGGVITITGTVDLDGSGTVTAGDATGVLLSGAFTGAIVTGTPMGLFKVSIAAFIDEKNQDLAAFYGLPGGPGFPWSGDFNISFNAAGTPPNPFTSTEVLSGDVVNSPVPEPMTMFLLGTSTLALAGLSRRNRSRKNVA